MGNSSLTFHVSARIPNELKPLMKPYETPNEFVNRAVLALRDSVHNQGNPLEHELLIKMVKVFAEKNIKMKLNQDEIELVKRLYQE